MFLFSIFTLFFHAQDIYYSLYLTAGEHPSVCTVPSANLWNLTNEGEKVNTGIYIYSLSAEINHKLTSRKGTINLMR